MAKRRPTTITPTTPPTRAVRLALKRTGATKYRIGIEAKVHPSVLWRFWNDGNITGENLDKLWRYAKLRLMVKPARKPRAKSTKERTRG